MLKKITLISSKRHNFFEKVVFNEYLGRARNILNVPHPPPFSSLSLSKQSMHVNAVVVPTRQPRLKVHSTAARSFH
jgi:hypothetical protein